MISVLVFPASAAAVSISSPADLAMPAIPGMGGASSGTVSWTVTTVASTYSLTIQTTGSPAMNSGGNSIADYLASTPETWSVAAANSEFGFSAEGPSTPTATWGTPSTGAGKYRGLSGPTQVTIANRGTILSGSETTTVYFKVEVGSGHLQPSGAYSASITATVTALV